MTPAEMREAYEGGATLHDIERLTGVNYSAVRLALLKAGCQMRRRGPPRGRLGPVPPHHIAWVKMWRSGMTQQQIADAGGVSQQAVNQAIKAADAKCAPSGATQAGRADTRAAHGVPPESPDLRATCAAGACVPAAAFSGRF